jgi:hypothetical protein
MRTTPFLVVLTVAGLALPAAVRSQGLADTAAKERERREAQKKTAPAKTFTDDDLARAKGSGASFAEGTTDETGGTAQGDQAKAEGGARPTGEAKKATAAEDEARAAAEAAWRKKLELSRKNVATYQENIEKVQLDLNDTSGGYYGARRQRMIETLDEQKKKLAETQQDVAKLEDEGRRNGYR